MATAVRTNFPSIGSVVGGFVPLSERADVPAPLWWFSVAHKLETRCKRPFIPVNDNVHTEDNGLSGERFALGRTRKVSRPVKGGGHIGRRSPQLLTQTLQEICE